MLVVEATLPPPEKGSFLALLGALAARGVIGLGAIFNRFFIILGGGG